MFKKKIRSIEMMPPHKVAVTFCEGETIEADLSPLLAQEMFFLLKTPAFFKAATVDPSGHAVVWNKEMDVSAYWLWTHREKRRSTPIDEMLPSP